MTDLLTIEQVIELIGVSRSTFHHHRSGASKTPFPEPAHVYGRSPVWKRPNVEEWMNQQRKPGRASVAS